MPHSKVIRGTLHEEHNGSNASVGTMTEPLDDDEENLGIPSGDEDESDGLVDYIAGRIQRWIVEGELPVGAWLRQSRIAENLGVSRTPVREALRKLQAAGFVEVLPRRGAVVKGLDARKLKDAFVVRAELEGLAAEIAAELVNDDQLERLAKALALFDQAVEQLSALPLESYWEEAHKANELFHNGILEAADNVCLARALHDPYLRGFSNAVWSAVLAGRTHILRRNMEEHHEILRAIQAHDGTKARLAMRNHVLRSGDLLAKAHRV